MEESHAPVELQDRPGHVGEDLEPVPDRLWLVVVPLDEGLAGLVVLARDLGRIEHEVVDAAGGGVEPPVLHTVNDGLQNNYYKLYFVIRCFN